MNKFIATGKLIKLSEGKRNDTHLLVYFKRPNQPDSYINFSLNCPLDPSIKINDIITLEGSLRGFNKKNESGKWRVNHFLEATSVKLAENEMMKEFNLPGHYNAKHTFIGYAAGRVRLQYDLEDSRKAIVVAIDSENKHPDMVTLVIKNNSKIASEISQIKKGNKIAFIINAQTQRKVVNNKEQKFVNFIVRDFKITN